MATATTTATKEKEKASAPSGTDSIPTQKSETTEAPGERVRRILEAIRQDSYSLRTHMRAQFYPWYWGAALGALGIVQQVLLIQSPWSTWVSAPMVATFYLLVSWLLRKRLTKQNTDTGRCDLAADWIQREPGHARVCTWAATAWLAGVHLASPTTWEGAWWCLAAGMLMLVACASRFWRHHRPEPALETPVEAAEEETGPPAPPGEHPTARRWRTKVGNATGCLPGSRLVDIVTEPFGIAATLALSHKHDGETARSVVRQIASGMGMPKSNLVIEDPEPTEENPNPDPTRPTIRLVTASAVTTPVMLEAPTGYWDGSDYRIPLGPYTDGDGWAEFTLYTENSMWGGFLAGATGTGKSNLVDILAVGAWNTGCTKVMFLDPKNGGSSPRIKERADWFVGNDAQEWDYVLDALIELIEARGAENAEELGTSGFTPTRERPGLLVIVEESHNIVTKNNAARWARVAREGRAAGVAAVMASQIYGLESFGGNDAVRDNITAGNTIALRVGANQSSMIKDVPLQPWRLPKMRGMAMVDAGRSVVFRAAHAPAADKLATHSENTVSMEQIMDTALVGAPAQFDALAMGALDAGSEGVYLRRHERTVQVSAGKKVQLDKYRQRGRAGASERDVPAAATIAALTPAQASARTLAPAGAPDPAALPVVDLKPAVAEAEARRRRTDQAILDELAAGEMRRGDLETAVRASTGAGRSSIQRALDRLKRDGAVEDSPEWGTWRRCDT